MNDGDIIEIRVVCSGKGTPGHGTQEHITVVDSFDEAREAIAGWEHLLEVKASPVYRKAFVKAMARKEHLFTVEERAAVDAVRKVQGREPRPGSVIPMSGCVPFCVEVRNVTRWVAIVGDGSRLTGETPNVD